VVDLEDLVGDGVCPSVRVLNSARSPVSSRYCLSSHNYTVSPTREWKEKRITGEESRAIRRPRNNALLITLSYKILSIGF
jgi:hypothetical protein